jgi:hypothetical protein
VATGTVWYWNGKSGWLKKDNVQNDVTAEARDVMVLASDITAGTILTNSVVTFDEGAFGDWRAYNIQVT